MTTTAQRVPHVPVIEDPVRDGWSTTAVVNDRPVEVMQAHRRLSGRPALVLQTRRYCGATDYIRPDSLTPGAYEPVVVTVSAPIRLSVEDVAAVLFTLNCPYDDLLDDEYVRWLVADMTVNEGCIHLEELRCHTDATNLDNDAATYLAYCRQRAATVFAPAARVGVAR